ncbi:MAG: hypothetical protein LCH41_13510 [Armatimonadetes bacterium]|nr:hypothetical protein [Armatimonadota bacterium]
MTNKDFDALIRSAFQEEEAGDRELVAGEASEAMKKEAQAYATLREDLHALRDIPECQMSTERLREAILARGMKPKRVIPWWQPAFAMAACAAVAALALAPGMKSAGMPEKTESPLVATHTVAEPTQPLALEESSIAPMTSQMAPQGSSANTGAAVAPPLTERRPETRVRPSNRRPNRFARLESPARDSARPASLDSINPGSAAAALVGAAADSAAFRSEDAGTGAAMPTTFGAADAGTGSGGGAGFAMPGNQMSRAGAPQNKSGAEPVTVIVIPGGVDPATGAPVAQEVDKREVVFGG